MSKSQSNIDKIKNQIRKPNPIFQDVTLSGRNAEQEIKGVHSELIDTKQPVKKKKVKFEDTHKRDTIWIRNDLKKMLDDNCVDRGDKTRIINEALKNYFSSEN